MINCTVTGGNALLAGGIWSEVRPALHALRARAVTDVR